MRHGRRVFLRVQRLAHPSLSVDHLVRQGRARDNGTAPAGKATSQESFSEDDVEDRSFVPDEVDESDRESCDDDSLELELNGEEDLRNESLSTAAKRRRDEHRLATAQNGRLQVLGGTVKC